MTPNQLDRLADVAVRQSMTSPDPEPIAVAPKIACKLLSIGTTRLYELLGSGALESYSEGRMRRITVASIKAYVASRLSEAVDAGKAA